MVLLLYGCGLRLTECVNLRIHCFNLDAMLLTVHDGKGQKDRTVPLPSRALAEIHEQIDKVRCLHAQDLAEGYAGVFLPRLLEKKYKNAAREYIWQWFFSATKLNCVTGLVFPTTVPTEHVTTSMLLAYFAGHAGTHAWPFAGSR